MIYLDNQATTQCDPEVLEAMIPFFSTSFGNAASTHSLGQLSYKAIQNARQELSGLLGGEPDELIFTSGATESNNIAIVGSANAYRSNNWKRRKIITSKLEHKSVLGPITALEKEGWQISYLPFDSVGRIDITKAAELITDETFLLSVQMANSEIGTIQDISLLSELARDKGVIVHCDASQALGKIPFDVDSIGIDLLSISAHKIYGPQGVGALWINKYTQMNIQPLMYGGNSVKNIRPGTLPTALIVGFGKASKLCSMNSTDESKRISGIRDRFEDELKYKIHGIKVNGDILKRLPNNSNITFPRISSEALLANLPNIMASTGSACESGSIEPSRILTSIGLSREEAANSIRFGFGRFTTAEEAKTAVEMIVDTWIELQRS